jgi:hypothetical protein
MSVSKSVKNDFSAYAEKALQERLYIFGSTGALQMEFWTQAVEYGDITDIPNRRKELSEIFDGQTRLKDAFHGNPSVIKLYLDREGHIKGSMTAYAWRPKLEEAKKLLSEKGWYVTREEDMIGETPEPQVLNPEFIHPGLP